MILFSVHRCLSFGWLRHFCQSIRKERWLFEIWNLFGVGCRHFSFYLFPSPSRIFFVHKCLFFDSSCFSCLLFSFGSTLHLPVKRNESILNIDIWLKLYAGFRFLWRYLPVPATFFLDIRYNLILVRCRPDTPCTLYPYHKITPSLDIMYWKNGKNKCV